MDQTFSNSQKTEQPIQKISPNRRRGEILINIDSNPRILCLTLGALAELEQAFNVNNLSELGAYFSNGKFGADDLVHIIGAGLRGGGNLYTDEDVRSLSIEGGAIGLAQIAADLLKITFSPKTICCGCYLLACIFTE